MMQQWIKAAQTGEEAAWNVLYRHYYPGLYSLALRRCGNPPAAKDAVQDTFMIAYLKLAQLKEVATFDGWIKKILIHRCYRALRHHRRHVDLDKIPLESDAWWEDELNRKFDRLSTQSRLYTAFARLPEVLRSTLLLRYFSSFQSYEQMAAILGVPVGTVRSRLNQAKLKLLAQWQQHPDASPKTWNECEEWNGFYQATYAGIHTQDECKNRFMNHLQNDLQISLTNQKAITGSWFFERKITEDQRSGSWLKPDCVVSCGNVSVVEASHYNSSEYPDHCPPVSVSVLYRHQGKVSKMHLYPSSK
ncbi:MAG: sigma-70 family RNA polymerase sigma factor [Ferruginibacter sp.]|nr:sigma-70 family RNA polymerase sigma factor [Cytophagales bacterium]